MSTQRPVQAHQRVGERDDCGCVRRDGSQGQPEAAGKDCRFPILILAIMLQYRGPDTRPPTLNTVVATATSTP
jgi:hypothetical protein